MKIYRVTPKNGKWIIQSTADRKTIKVDGSPFAKQTEAEAAMFKLLQSGKKETKPGITFVDAFYKFAQMKLGLKNDTNRVTEHSLKRYMTTYTKRIVPYMDKPGDEKVLLSNFNLDHMEAFLKRAYDDKVPFKTLKNTVKDIKHFLRQANLRGWSPCMDMSTFKIYDYDYVIPKDDSLIAKKPTNVLSQEKCFKLIMNAYLQWKQSKNLDRDAAMRFAIFSLMFMFGLRASEMQGLKRSSIDLNAKTLKVEGVWITAEGGYLNRLKNEGSRRTLNLEPDAVKFFKMWFYYLDGFEKNNPFVLPAFRENGPLSYKYINSSVWKGYAQEGLADITVRRDGHVVINSSALKGHPTKTFRHRFCTKLMRALKDQDMDQNEVKAQAGHVQFTTTSGIYGNHLIDISKEDQEKIAKARGKHLGTSIISEIIEK
jgi:integrase